ncbi:MAG TPA: hypothetical protein VGJ95_19205 [Pseudonocardiaceae bacterium]
MSTAAGAGCAACLGRGEVGEDLRLIALALLDRFEPGARSVLAGLRVEADAAASDGQQRPSACQWCPLCSLIALVRGEAPELGGRIAEQATALLTTLRALLEQPRTPSAEPPRQPRVQQIEVRPAPNDGPAGGADGEC